MTVRHVVLNARRSSKAAKRFKVSNEESEPRAHGVEVGFFGPSKVPSVRPNRSITGGPLAIPEDIGKLPRRVRLMAHAQRALADHPLAQASSFGQPLGDGTGMEAAVAHIAPIFARERSIVRWVALRGALLFLDMHCPEPASWERLVRGMGLRTEGGKIVIVSDLTMSPDAVEMAIGVAASIHNRLVHYDEAERASITDLNSAPLWSTVHEAIGLDYIAWTAVALNRAGLPPAPEMEPGALDSPGFYAEPVFAKAERYWDGTYWTPRVRRLGERSELDLPLA